MKGTGCIALAISAFVAGRLSVGWTLDVRRVEDAGRQAPARHAAPAVPKREPPDAGVRTSSTAGRPVMQDHPPVGPMVKLLPGRLWDADASQLAKLPKGARRGHGTGRVVVGDE